MDGSGKLWEAQGFSVSQAHGSPHLLVPLKVLERCMLSSGEGYKRVQILLSFP